MYQRGKVLSLGGEVPVGQDTKSKRAGRKPVGSGSGTAQRKKDAPSKKEKRKKKKARTLRGTVKRSAEREERAPLTPESPVQEQILQPVIDPKVLLPPVKVKREKPPKPVSASPKDASEIAKIPNGAIIETEKLKYRVINKLGAGGCGETFVVENITTKRKVCAKVEFLRDGEHRLRREFDIYRDIDKVKKTNKKALPHLLQCVDFGEVQEKIHFMFLPLCHNSLSGIISSDKGYPNLPTAFEMSLQVLEGIRELHSIGYIHRDLKPANICINSAMTTAYIIDFGMSCKFISDPDKMPKTSVYNFIGTRTYAPRDAHKGLPQSRKSDIESWLYLILELFVHDILPWHNEGSEKITLYMKDLFFSSCYSRRITQAPGCFNDCIPIIEVTAVVDAPDYDKIVALIQKEAETRKVPLKQKFNFDSSPVEMDIALWKTGQAVDRSNYSSLKEINMDDKSALPCGSETKSRQMDQEEAKKTGEGADNSGDQEDELRSNMKCRVMVPRTRSDEDSEKCVKRSEKQQYKER